MSIISDLSRLNCHKIENPEVKPFLSSPFNKESLLEETINQLQSERDTLVTTVSDLRQLLKRISLQQDQEAVRKHEVQLEHLAKIKSLKAALQVSEKHSSHLGTIKDFWKDFIN